MEHQLPNDYTNRPINIHVVGCGGTGSQLMPRLVQLHNTLLALGHQYGLTVTLWDADAVSARLDQLVADFIANGPTEDEIARTVASSLSARIQALEPVGGFGGKAVVLADGELYADDPGFYRREMADLAALTPTSVKAVMNRWLTRPVLATRVDPREREAYAEAADSRPAPEAAAPLPITPPGCRSGRLTSASTRPRSRQKPAP